MNNNKIIEQKALQLASLNINNIYLFDVMDDEVSIYDSLSGTFGKKETNNLTQYLENIKNNIKEEYVSAYMNSISIPKLEEERKNGNDVVKYSYTTLNNKTFTNLCTLINLEDKTCVLVVEISSNNSDLKTSDNEKYNTLIGVLSDSIIKIQNIFNLDSKSLENVKSIEEYIMSIFSNLYTINPELKNKVNKTAINVSGRSTDTILIVDDDMIMRGLIKKVFAGSTYKLVEAKNGKEAIDYLKENETKGLNEASDHVIGIFLDLTMPVLDGFAVLEYLSKNNYLNKLPVIIISGDYEKETKQRVYNYSIADMLEKPFDIEVVRHRITNLINLYKSSNSLNELIDGKNKDLINPFIESYRLDYEKNTTKVSNYIKFLAEKIMESNPEYNLTDEMINKMSEASMYYDIGFYSIPRSILLKKENLSSDELKMITNYPIFGSKMINYVFSMINDELYKNYAFNITKFYHENYNGTGYPTGLKEDEIPLEARIAAIAISYNNIKNKNGDARSYLVSKKGIMFDPTLVDLFINNIDELKEE